MTLKNLKKKRGGSLLNWQRLVDSRGANGSSGMIETGSGIASAMRFDVP
jgi:hypothetical protein